MPHLIESGGTPPGSFSRQRRGGWSENCATSKKRVRVFVQTNPADDAGEGNGAYRRGSKGALKVIAAARFKYLI